MVFNSVGPNQTANPKNMKPSTNQVKALGLLFILGLFSPCLQADVVVLQSGAVITGNILQQDSNGVLLQMAYGTFRYPPNLLKEVKREAATAPHVSNNGQVIPDWAQMVSLLATNRWADGLRQVPAPVVSYGLLKNIPYISFRCAAGGYELNIYGDLDRPAAIQFGALNYLSQDAGARSNCVNFVRSLLASPEARAMVRSLDLNRKVLTENGGLAVGSILPGEWGSYGGWWVLVYNANAVARAQASEAELLALSQARVPLPDAPAPAAATAATPSAAPASDPTAPATAAPAGAAASGTTTTYDTYYGYGTTYPVATSWTRDEINDAHPAVTPATEPVATGAAAYPAAAYDRVYPRTYTRTAAGYDPALRRR